MNIRFIIFDLDQTLFESKLIEPFRKKREWQTAYRLIQNCISYKGIDEILTIVNNKSIKTAIVTSSPKAYAERVVQHFNWKFDIIIGYHDTAMHKPHPDPILKAIRLLNAKTNETLSVGDSLKDIQASKSAGCMSGACYWGSEEKEQLIISNATYHFNEVKDLINLIK